MAIFDFRVLLETVEGKKSSYMSQSFVDTSVDVILSASQVYNRITGSVSCSYQNSRIFSGNDFNTSKTFKDNLILSASLTGSLNTGSINFTATTSEYDRLLRYKFFGEKVCNVLGLPENQWVYVDQLRLPADEEANIFQGNIEANSVYVQGNLSFANNANVNSDIPFYIDTGSDRYIKFIDTRGTGNIGLIFGYDKDNDLYEINASENTTFNITNLNSLTADSITAAQITQATSSTQVTQSLSLNNLQVSGTALISGSTAEEPLLRVQGNISSSGIISASQLRIEGTSQFGGNINVDGNVTATRFTTQVIAESFSEGSTVFGDTNDDLHRFTGSVLIRQTGSDPGLFITGSDLRVQNSISSSGFIHTLSHITASGNVSASKIITNRVSAVAGDMSLISSVGDVIIRSSNTNDIKFQEAEAGGIVEVMRYDGGENEFIFSKGLDITGDITASGNISASGVINARSINAEILDADTVTDGLAAIIVAEIDDDEIPIAKLAEDSVRYVAGTGLTGG